MDYQIRKDRKLPYRYHIDLRIKLCHRTKKTYHNNTPAKLAPSFVNEIFDTCKGIVSLTVEQHTLSVSHHSMFHWETELKEKIVEILRINFATTDKSVCDISKGHFVCSPSKGMLHEKRTKSEPQLLLSPKDGEKKVD